MKKILITRKLLKESEEKALKTFDSKLNGNDELYSQSKLIELSEGYDAILTSLTDKMDENTISKLPDSIKVISNFAVGFGNIDLEAAKKTAEFIWAQQNLKNKQLWRFSIQGHTSIPANQEDYAYYANALLRLYDLTEDALWLERAEQVTKMMLTLFWDNQSAGFFMNIKIGININF